MLYSKRLDPSYQLLTKTEDMALVLKKTSYENSKAGFAWTNVRRPSGRYFLAYGYGNFFADGKTSLFTATLTYDPSKPLSDASGSLFEFWSLNKNGWKKRDSVFTDNFSSSIHPRKALVADFNGDTIPDIFVASHGYDSSPFPGERNKIVLSQGNGKFSVRDSSPDVDFFHGASAIDVDQDGDVDVVAAGGGTSLEGIYTLLNDGGGSFAKDTSSRYPAFLKQGNPYYSIEFIDVNNDGLADLFLGGHEWGGAQTLLFLNPGNFDFSKTEPIYIPSVPNEGVVLDFLVTDSSDGKDIWILRTSGGDGTFYQSTVLQKFSLQSLTSEIVYNTRDGSWTPWIYSDSKSGKRSITSADGKNLFQFDERRETTKNDILVGNSSNNTIDGLGGANTLTGTAKKADVFALTGTPEFGADTADRITNFNPKEKDKLQIDVSDFGSNATGTFRIAKNAKTFTKALASTTDFIYLKSTGELFYNENGMLPGFGDGGVFAIIENKANITTKNIEFL